ncbi:MAG: InlB B-repeat-containing protein [Clostridia bacterium]
MNTKNVHVIREPAITKIVMLFSILMCILLYKPITAEATSADCDKGYGIPSPSTMVDLATGKGAYWSSGGSWQSWIDFYKSMGYTYTGYSDCYMLYGANSSGHQTNEYVHGYWMDLTKNGQTYWAILRNDFGDTNTYYSRYNSWHCVNETLNGVNEYTWYYTNGIGIVYTNTWLHTRTHDPHPNKSDIHGYFCFNASGRMSVGWHKGTDGKWYYFRIDTVRGEDGANTRTGMSEHGGLIWNTVHSPTTYGTNGLYSEGLYLFEGLDVATNVYRRNTNGTFDYVGTDVTRINAGSNSNQIEPFRSKKISSNTKYVNDQIYNTNALYINTNVAGTYTADQNVLLVNDDYQHIRVNEYTYYIDRKKFTLTQNINSDTETTKTSTIYYEGTQNIPTPTKTGYKFDGWEVSGNGSKMDGNTFTMGDADATITAKWTPIDYTISYDLQGGTINGQPTKYTIESPTLNIPRPIKTGYTFLGWTGSNGNKNQLDVSITHGSIGNKAYTAHWAANKYILTFNYNKPSNASSNIANGTITSKTVTYDSPYDELPAPTLRGWTFNGWFTAPSGGTQIKANNIFRELNNQTLYAHWSANIYEIKLDSKLEGYTGSTVTTVIYEKYDIGFYSDKACTKQITSITIPHKIGNAFNGYTDNRNIIIDSNGAIKVKTNYFLQNTTLNAKWTLNTYRVIFNGNRNSAGKTDTLVYKWSNSDTNNKALTPNGYIRAG